jgi:hypothetical protein
MNKLDAVNACLRAVTLSPVTSLTSGPDATKAATKVDEVSEAIQEEGWSVNTDYCVTLALDINGKCPLPANTLVVSGKDYNDGFSRVSLRYDPSGSGVAYLWDVDNKTFIFTTTAPGGVKVDITYLYAFEDLPPTLQRYIAARAAREYQESDLGSGVADKFTSRREQEALTTLLEAEADEEDWNVLRDCPSASLIASRYNIFDGV